MHQEKENNKKTEVLFRIIKILKMLSIYRNQEKGSFQSY